MRYTLREKSLKKNRTILFIFTKLLHIKNITVSKKFYLIILKDYFLIQFYQKLNYEKKYNL